MPLSLGLLICVVVIVTFVDVSERAEAIVLDLEQPVGIVEWLSDEAQAHGDWKGEHSSSMNGAILPS
jgi:hypothetical protein